MLLTCDDASLPISGCAFRYASKHGKQEELCFYRANANWVGSFHVAALTAAGIALTSSEGGAGLDVLATMRLELTCYDCIEGALVAAASMIALFLYSTRDEAGVGNGLLSYIFIACWVVVSLTLAFRSRTARESRIARREESNRRPQDAAQEATPVNAVKVVLPRIWSYIMILLSFFSYAAPQAMRLVLPQLTFRGTIGGFSNLCFVGHVLMLANNGHSSTRGQSFAHLAVHITGSASGFVAESRVRGLSVGLASSYLIGMGGNVFQLWLWTRLMKPMLETRNPTLLAELPITTFRWLFQRGGLTMGLYCFFEALGVSSSDRSTEDITPWLTANSTVLIHVTFSAVLSLTLLADSRTSLSAVLRGLAPLYMNIGLAVVGRGLD